MTKISYKRKPPKFDSDAASAARLRLTMRDKGIKPQHQTTARGHVPPRTLPPRPLNKGVEIATKAALAEHGPPRHPRDIINEQLRAKAPRAKQVKRLSPKLTHDARVARLVDAARARGVGILTTEIETHERKIGELREALALVTREKKP